MTRSFDIIVASAVFGLVAPAAAAQVFDDYYECAYRFVDLGTPPGVPGALGGLVFKAGDPDTLLIGGSANTPGAQAYAVPVLRDASQRVIGFGPASTIHASVPNIDGDCSTGRMACSSSAATA